MTTMTDHDDLAPRRAHARHFDMNLGHQGASGIEYLKSHGLGLGPHRLGHAMRGKHHNGARRRFVQFVDENGALLPQVLNHIAVMDNFVPHINWRAMQLERPLDNIDGAVDTGAKPPGLGQYDVDAGLRIGFRHYKTPNKETSMCRSAPARGWLKSNKTASSPYCLSTPE